MKIVAIMAVYNEERIIAASLEHWRTHGVKVLLVDNESTDRTLEIAEQYRGSCLLDIEFLPRHGVFHLERILKCKEKLSESIDADWLLHVDADEFHQPFTPTQSLHDALVDVDAAGYNAVSFLEFTF
ncbi:glycosyltransferase family 2 protein, partial [bacterium]|nr:glycosyltransferase family 2 protein [bacterium]